MSTYYWSPDHDSKLYSIEGHIDAIKDPLWIIVDSDPENVGWELDNKYVFADLKTAQAYNLALLKQELVYHRERLDAVEKELKAVEAGAFQIEPYPSNLLT